MGKASVSSLSVISLFSRAVEWAHDRAMARVLLLLPSATYRAADFTAAAAAIGAEVVIGCERPQVWAKSMDDRALVVPFADPPAATEAIVELDARTRLDAVVAVDDQGVLVAALASARLGLVHNPPGTVAATRDKIEMRMRLEAASVPQPRWAVVVRASRSVSNSSRLYHTPAGAASSVGFPCVVKPVSLSASRGVIRADDERAAVTAVARVRNILAEAGDDPDGPVLVEQFVPGKEVAVEALLVAGRLIVLAVFDKPDPLDGPYFEETLYVTPSRLAPILALVERRTAEATTAMGLLEGPVHAELRIGDEVVMLELAARAIGGLCARSLKFGLGMSLEELMFRNALGAELKGLSREVGLRGHHATDRSAGPLESVGQSEHWPSLASSDWS